MTSPPDRPSREAMERARAFVVAWERGGNRQAFIDLLALALDEFAAKAVREVWQEYWRGRARD